MNRSTNRARARRTSSVTTLGAIGAATALGLTGTTAPAVAAPAPAELPREFTDIPRARSVGTGPAQAYSTTTHVDHATTPVLYTVRAGDTVSHLALRYGTSVSAIVKANDLGSRALIRIGQTLRIPGADAKSSKSSAPKSQSISPTKSTRSGSYTVRAGDTVSAIAVKYDSSVSAIVKANNLNSNALILIGQKLTIPGHGKRTSHSATRTSTPAPKSPAPKASAPKTSKTRAPSKSGSYTVRAGDTVSAIAVKYDSSVSAIVKANNLNSNALILIGQKLTIPGHGSAATPSGTTSSKAPTTSSSKSSSSPKFTSSVVHTVKSGDTLSNIAQRYGSSVSAIAKKNSLSSADIIRVGQKLTIPSALVSNTFLHYSYSADVTSAANKNKSTLLSKKVPSKEQMKAMIRETAQRMGVNPSLALAIAHQESGFDMSAVSPANAIGVMQVIPSSGEWAEHLVGHEINLLDPQDNVTAGIAILRALQQATDNPKHQIGGYYQGLGSVRRNGLYSDTKNYVAKIQSLMTRY